MPPAYKQTTFPGQDMAPNGRDGGHSGQAPAVQQAFPKSLSQNG